MSVIRVGDLMSRDLVALEPDHDLTEISAILGLIHVRHLPVEDNGKLLGIVTHRDLLAATGKSDRTRAREIMTPDPQSLSSDAPALQAAQLMREHRFGCVPVVDEGRLVGIVTEADFIDLAIKELSRRS